MAQQNDNTSLWLLLLAVGAGITVAIISTGATPDNGQGENSAASLAYINNYTGSDKQAFANAVVAMANQLGISANDIMFVMYNESGLNPGGFSQIGRAHV